jgi:hypothetical protein
MDNGNDLLVGSVSVCAPDLVDDALLAIFRDDMAQVTEIPFALSSSEVGRCVEDAVFRAPGQVIAARLDVMGIDAALVLTGLDRTLKETVAEWTFSDDDPTVGDGLRAEKEILAGMTAQDWVSMLAAVPDGPGTAHYKGPSTREWLVGLLGTRSEWDALRRLRLILLAFPEADVSLDVGWLGDDEYDGWPRELASTAQSTIRMKTAIHAPIIVLTEGTTDAEFLGNALSILHPELTDLVRFLDYERKPEGGAGAVLRAVRAFDAAGIANRIVAVLDNDTAAADALRGYQQAKLSERIRVIQYPPLDLARQYPTLGPPNVRSPHASMELADVNGLAGSIELYLGRDVLTGEDGHLRPVQWKSFIPPMGRYHGEVTGKHDIHKAFRAKAVAALSDNADTSRQDWEGLRLILDAILTAFRSPGLSGQGSC